MRFGSTATDLEQTIARARAAHDAPRALVRRTDEELDAAHLVDHVRLTRWVEEEASKAAMALGASMGLTPARVMSCSARNRATSRCEAIWVYEWMDGDR